MSGDNATSADNQQETLYYFCGFMVGESSICLIKATNKKGGTGFYYAPDFTVSNSDLTLLQLVNRVIANGRGVISPIKGGYNLSIRGKEKVRLVLSFFDQYPPITGDMIKEKLLLLRKAITVLDRKKNRNKRFPKEAVMIERLRQKLKQLKIKGKASRHFRKIRASRKETGNFLAGIVDAEGSMGFRRSVDRLQPYFCVAMREESIIDLFRKYFGFGSKYYRPASKLYQFETGKKENVLHLSNFFLFEYPVHLPKNRERMQKIQWILNDYTPRSAKKADMI